jgi:hypothetical protein
LTDQDILDFVSASLKKISDLELLLFLRAAPGQRWTVPDLVRELRSSASTVEGALAQLSVSRLVVEAEPGVFALAAGTPEREALLAALDTLYRERPFTLISFMVEQASAPLKSFSDAFKFKD